jgi:hypothetical protein
MLGGVLASEGLKDSSQFIFFLLAFIIFESVSLPSDPKYLLAIIAKLSPFSTSTFFCGATMKHAGRNMVVSSVRLSKEVPGFAS